jgi:hypothetical protein
LSGEQIEEIRTALQTEEKIDRTFTVEVKDEGGVVVAEVQKVLHVGRKERRSPR